MGWTPQDEIANAVACEENHNDMANPHMILDARLWGEADERKKGGGSSDGEEEESTGYVSDQAKSQSGAW